MFHYVDVTNNKKEQTEDNEVRVNLKTVTRLYIDDYIYKNHNIDSTYIHLYIYIYICDVLHVFITYLTLVQYERSQTHQSDLTGNHHHKLLQGLGHCKALRLAGWAGVRGSSVDGGEVRGGGA